MQVSQISSANLLIAGAFGNRAAGAPQANPAAQASPAAQKAVEDKFVPIDFKKSPAAATTASQATASNPTATPSAYPRPGAQLDIRV